MARAAGDGRDRPRGSAVRPMSFEIHLTGHVKSVVHETLPGLIADLVASGITAGDCVAVGRRRPRRRPRSGSGGSRRSSVSRPLVPEIEALRAELVAKGVTRVVLAGMGGSSLAPEVIAQTSGVPLVILDSTAPEPGARRDRRRRRGGRSRADRAGRLVQVRVDGRDRLRQARLRGRLPRHRDRSRRADRRRHRPRLAAGSGGTRGRLPRLQRRSDRRRPLLGADRVRPGADRARRRRPPRAPRRGRGDAARGRDRQRRQPRARARRGDRRRRAAPRQARAHHRRHAHHRPARLDRAARRRVHRQGGHRHPARRAPARLARGREHRRPTCRSCASSTRPTSSTSASGTRARSSSAARSARSSSCGSTRPRSPAGCWGSTRSTSPTSNPPRSRHAACSTRAPSRPRRRSRWTASRCASPIRRWRHPEPSPACSTRCGRRLPADGYVSIQAYVDRLRLPQLQGLRELVAADSGRPVTFGWGPRFLHSTGQFHKGGPAVGVFLQILEQTDVDLEIPGRPFTFGQLIQAQAAGDAERARRRARPSRRHPHPHRPPGRGAHALRSRSIGVHPDDGAANDRGDLARAQPAARPRRPPPQPHRRSERARDLRGDGRPLPQEAHARRVRPGQPRSAAARVRARRLRATRLGGPGLRARW